MMRQIVFKGKSESSGEWIYGTLGEIDGKPYISGLGYDTGEETVAFVDGGTVGQFTGVLDKNGLRIFEGDRVAIHGLHPTQVLGDVTFRDGAFGVTWVHNGVERFYAFVSMCNVEYEVLVWH